MSVCSVPPEQWSNKGLEKGNTNEQRPSHRAMSKDK